MEENNKEKDKKESFEPGEKPEKLEEDLLLLKQQLEFILGITKTGLDIIDSEFNIRYIDSAWQKIYGDPTGKKCYEYFMDRKQVCPGCGIPRALETKTTVVTERILVKENNRPIQVTTIPFQSKEGEWLVAEVKVDISKIKKKEEIQKLNTELEQRVIERAKQLGIVNKELEDKIAQQEKIAKLLREERDLFIAGPIIIFKWKNIEGWPVEYVSPNIVEQFGYTENDFITGKVLYADIVHPDDLARVAQEVKTYSKEGLPYFEQRYRIKRKDGEYRWVYDFTVVERNINKVITHYHGYIMDDTERKKAEESLKESETKYRNLVESSLEGIGISQGNKVIFANKALLNIFGYKSLKEFVKIPLLDHVAPESRKMIQERMKKRGKGESIPTHFEYKIIRKDGKIKDFEASSSEVTIEGEKYVQSTFRDITERKKAEDELRLYAKIMQNMAEGVILIRANEGVIAYTNPKFEEMFGYGPGELIGKNISVVNAPTDKSPEEIAEEIQKSLRKKGMWQGEVYNIKKDGTPFWCYANVATFKHHAYGEVWVAVHTDITERKRTEEALRRTQFSVDKAADAVFWVKPDGCIEYTNDQACRSLGYSRQELLSMTIYDIDPNFPIKIWKKHWQEMKQLGSFTFESVQRSKTRRVFPVEVSLNHMEFGGKEYSCAFVRDITERKEIEKVKDNLIRDVSHSLKTPVAMIEMAYEMFQRGREVGDTQRIEKAQSIMAHNIHLMHKDINNILSLEQAIKERKSNISLRRLINEIVKDVSAFITQKELKFSTKVASGADKIFANKKAIKSLLYNILDNAIKFTERGRITLTARLKDGWIEIRCRDTGYGINPKYIDKVFEKFFKRHPAIPGTGLGLPICKEIVTRNKGTIKVMSKGEGKGTTVVVRLLKKGGKYGRGKK